MKDDMVYIDFILERIARIEEDTSVGFDTFMSKHTFQDSVLRNLQTMAESTQRISNRLKERHPEIEWKSIAAFRNVLVHDYLGIDIERIWYTTQNDVPELKRFMLQLQDETKSNEIKNPENKKIG